MNFYHYTCWHSARAIGRYGTLRPVAHPQMGGAKLVWLTDMAVPDRDGLGLTSHTLRCDRLDCRYLVEPSADIVPWPVARRADLGQAMIRSAGVRAFVEFEAGRMPDRWFVSLVAVPAQLDRTYGVVAMGWRA